MSRLKTLLISSNQINRIESEISEKLTSLETLVLNDNKLAEFEDIESLSGCKNLRYLSFLDNPITKKAHYRLTLIHKIPQLRCLDFRKISQAERQAATEMFSVTAKPAGKAGRGRKAATTVAADEEPKTKRQKLNAKEIAKIKAQIVAADSMEEIARLEKILETGYNL